MKRAAFLALGLGGMWIVNFVRFAITGAAPPGSVLVETPTVVHLGYALDLSLLVPAYAFAAVLLWRRAAWASLPPPRCLSRGPASKSATWWRCHSKSVPGAPTPPPSTPVNPRSSWRSWPP